MNRSTRELSFAAPAEPGNSPRSSRRLLTAIGASLTLGAVVAVGMTAPAANAATVTTHQNYLAPAVAGTLTATPADVVQLVVGVPTVLTGLAVTGDPTDALAVTVSTTSGTLAMTPSRAPLLTSSSWSGQASISLRGTQDLINATLATTTITGGKDATASVSISAAVQDSVTPTYVPSSGHYYAYIEAAGESWEQADAEAKTLHFRGQQGYLATIPTAAVNDEISLLTDGNTDVLFGARAYEESATDGSETFAVVGDTTYARVWRWTVGADESPIQGDIFTICTNITSYCERPASDTSFASWFSGEPNNTGGYSKFAYQGEWVATTNFSSIPGLWNDDPNNDYNLSSGYVVEFGGKTNSDPSAGLGYSVPTIASTTLQIKATLATLVITNNNLTVLAGTPILLEITGADASGGNVDVSQGVALTVDGVPSASRRFTFTTAGPHTVKFTDVATGVTATQTVTAIALATDLPPITWVAPGTSTTLTMAMSDTANPTVVWKKSVKPGGPWAIVAGQKGTSYTFTPTSSFVYYQATVITKAGPVATTVTSVHIASLPVTQPNKSTTLTPGTKLYLTATAKGNPFPTTMKWQTSADGGLSWVDVAGATTTTYAFSPTLSGTRYRAQFTNLAGTTNSSVSVVIVNQVKKI